MLKNKSRDSRFLLILVLHNCPPYLIDFFTSFKSNNCIFVTPQTDASGIKVENVFAKVINNDFFFL